MASPLQLFPALDPATEAALRASIQRFGVLVPVTKDQHGRILDGHHRIRIAEEMGAECEVRVRPVADEDEAREIARTLNEDRRQLPREQRREVVAVLREDGHSQRAIAGALGVSQSLVHKDLRQLNTSNQLTEPNRVIGLDGKSRPASKPKPEPTRKRGPSGGFRDPLTRYEPKTERHRQGAAGQYARLRDGLSEISGLCRGLKEVDLGMAAASCSPDELQAWAKKAGALSGVLRKLKTDLEVVASGKA